VPQRLRRGFGQALLLLLLAAPQLAAVLLLLLSPQVTKRGEGRKGGRKGARGGGPQKLPTARRQRVREGHEGPCVVRGARWRRHPLARAT